MLDGKSPSKSSRIGSRAAGERPAVSATKAVKLAGKAARLTHPKKRDQVKYEICSLPTKDEATFKASLRTIVLKYTDKTFHESMLWVDDNF